MAARKTAKKVTTKKPVVKNDTEISSTQKSFIEQKIPALQQKRSQLYVGIVVIIVLLLALLYYFKSWIVVALVNGRPVSRFAYEKELQKQAGKQVLNSLIVQTLVQQAAQKQHIVITDKDTQADIKRIDDSLKQQGQNLDQALAAKGMTRDDLLQQVKIEKILEKLAGKDISVTNGEIDDYLNKNKDSISADSINAQLRDNIKQQLLQQKQNSAVQGVLQKLQSSAKIQYWITQ